MRLCAILALMAALLALPAHAAVEYDDPAEATYSVVFEHCNGKIVNYSSNWGVLNSTKVIDPVDIDRLAELLTGISTWGGNRMIVGDEIRAEQVMELIEGAFAEVGFEREPEVYFSAAMPAYCTFLRQRYPQYLEMGV